MSAPSARPWAPRRTILATGPAPTNQLRIATFATALAGVWTMQTAGVVAAPTALIAAVLVAAGTWGSVRLTTPAARENRRRVAAVVLALSALGAVVSNGGAISDSTPTLLGLLLCAAAVVHSLVLDTVRDQRVNVVVSLSMLLLSAGLAPGLSIAVPVVLTWACAVAALVIASGEGQGADASTQAVVASRSSSSTRSTAWTTVAGCVVVAVLVGVALALVLPHPPGVSARSSFGTGSDPSTQPTGSTTRAAAAYLGEGRLSLDTRGQLSNTPIAVVTGGAGELWRANVMLRYDGHGWYPSTGEDAKRQTSSAIPADPLSPPQPSPVSRRDGVGWLGAAPPTVLSPGIPTAVDLRDGGRLVLDADGRIVPVTDTMTPSYTVTSDTVERVSRVRGPEVGVDASAEVWRALPASVPARVTTLARQLTAGTANRADAVRAVETYLRANATYDLNSPVPSQLADSVDDFLFVSRSGFCEHFASAEVVLLRSVGIPSRLVTGFSSSAPASDGTNILRSSDAHAWVEVWIEGSGWVSSDPTAGTTQATHSSSGFTSWLQKLVDAVTGSTQAKILLAVGLLLAAAAALLLPGRRFRNRRRGADVDLVPSAPLFAAFHRLEEALARSGAPRAPAESVRTLSERWDDGTATAEDREVVGALLTVERASYATVPPNREEARVAAETIDRATARLLTTTDD